MVKCTLCFFLVIFWYDWGLQSSYCLRLNSPSWYSKTTRYLPLLSRSFCDMTGSSSSASVNLIVRFFNLLFLVIDNNEGCWLKEKYSTVSVSHPAISVVSEGQCRSRPLLIFSQLCCWRNSAFLLMLMLLLTGTRCHPFLLQLLV